MTLDELREITQRKAWRRLANGLLADSSTNAEFMSSFSTYWIEGGHHIREQLEDDRQLVQVLRKLLPPYIGGPVELFRGENLERWSKRQVGLAWTPSREIAEMFGRGLNALGSGGVLLRGVFDRRAIISVPNGHSRYLGEEQFTVDPFALTSLTELARYPSSM